MLKNKELVEQVLDLINTMIEASWYLHNQLKQSDMESAIQIGNDIKAGLEYMYPIAKSFVDEINNDQESNAEITITTLKLNTDIACLCIKDSLEIILINPQDYFHKIEFELIPMLRLMHETLYAVGLVYPDPQKIKDYLEYDRKYVYNNKYLEEAQKNDHYKYDLTICVLAYNNLNYTKLCVSSILKYVPSDISYELILINHGSNDGTKEYFESIKPTKQIDIKINGGGFSAYDSIREGKYLLMVSNDVIVTENAIRNMYRCIDNDPSIIRVVPTTTHVSNLQTIDTVPAKFNSIEDIYSFGKSNNIYDEYRHEQRVRLCDPIAMTCFQRMDISKYDAPYSKSTIFPDDKVSLLIRRNGFKNVLAKDAFCFHFGSVTLKDEIAKTNEIEFYNRGRAIFEEEWGIDPWGTGFCYDPDLIEALPCNQKGHVDILAINCGMGSNPLKMKEQIKEVSHNLDVKIYNITDKQEYYKDLLNIGSVHIVHAKEELSDFLKTLPIFDFIIMEDKFDFEITGKFLNKLFMKNMKSSGMLVIKKASKSFKDHMLQNKKRHTYVQNWSIFS